MKFTLKKPCANCPFRTDKALVYGWLGRERAAEIAENIKEYAFPCHKTTAATGKQAGREIHCAGALIALHKQGILQDNRLIQVAQRLGLYDGAVDFKDMHNVVDNLDQFVDIHSDTKINDRMKIIMGMNQIQKEGLIKTLQV